MKIGSSITLNIYGHSTKVRVLAITNYGCIDVERLDDGKCFRISGLVGYTDLKKESL